MSLLIWYTISKNNPVAPKRRSKLGEFYATSIAGNDILSSALYVSGIAAIFAGIYAPLVLLAVALVLFFYRSVYREVVGALPVNGGAYNALLNGTSKPFAAVGGVMTGLSYTAMAVISAKAGVEYLFKLIEQYVLRYHLPFDTNLLHVLVIPGVILVFLCFALLVASGKKDPSRLAGAIFLFHLFTLTSFLVFGAWLIITHGSAVAAMNVDATRSLVEGGGGLLKTLFLAFSACLLGVSGFESSANFVEEQKPGVFPKTLRNMTLAVLVFNPLIAYIVLNVLTIGQIGVSKDFVLAQAAIRMDGLPFLTLISVDAFLVLAGAVLTGYIGMSGLMNRMALDDCLPHFLLKENKYKAHPRIIWTFFFLCLSILLLIRGELLSLAGVYTISFLSVMTLFAGANLILRKTREDLKRPYSAPFPFVIIALLSTLVGLMGIVSIDPKNTGYFLAYFLPAIVLSLSVIYKRDLYRALRDFFKLIPPLNAFFERRFVHASEDHLYVFVHHVDRLYRILNYIHNNESGHFVTLVHCKHGHPGRAAKLDHIIHEIKEAGFFPHFTIDVQYLNKRFNPLTVAQFAKQHRIQRNKIFIGSIHEYHEFTYEELIGVRIIL